MSDTEPRGILPIQRNKDIDTHAQELGDVKGEYFKLKRDLIDSAANYKSDLTKEVRELLTGRQDIVAARGSMVSLDETTQAGVFKEGWLGGKWLIRVVKGEKDMSIHFKGAWTNPQISKVIDKQQYKGEWGEVLKEKTTINFSEDGAVDSIQFERPDDGPRRTGIEDEDQFWKRMKLGALGDFLKMNGVFGEGPPSGLYAKNIQLQVLVNPEVVVDLKYKSPNSFSAGRISFEYSNSAGLFESRKGNNVVKSFRQEALKDAWQYLLGRFTFAERIADGNSQVSSIKNSQKDDLDPSLL